MWGRLARLMDALRSVSQSVSPSASSLSISAYRAWLSATNELYLHLVMEEKANAASFSCFHPNTRPVELVQCCLSAYQQGRITMDVGTACFCGS